MIPIQYALRRRMMADVVDGGKTFVVTIEGDFTTSRFYVFDCRPSIDNVRYTSGIYEITEGSEIKLYCAVAGLAGFTASIKIDDEVVMLAEVPAVNTEADQSEYTFTVKSDCTITANKGDNWKGCYINTIVATS